MSNNLMRFVCVFGLGIVTVAASSGWSSPALAPTDARDALSKQERREIEKYLGRGVLGEALPADAVPAIDELPRVWLDRDGIRRVVHGKNKGKDITASLRRIDRDDGSRGYRLDLGGKTVLYGRFEPDGSVNQYAVDDRDESVMTQYEPAIPIFRSGMRPGDRVEQDCAVSVYDLTNPGKRKHSGRFHITMEYLGNYRVTVPAGTFDTACIKWVYKGKVGPAKVEDRSYWFFDLKAGPVAWINKTDVSALLVYQDHSKRASVLVRLKSIDE